MTFEVVIDLLIMRSAKSFDDEIRCFGHDICRYLMDNPGLVCCVQPRPRIYRPRTPDFFALLFMLYSTAAYVSYKFEWEIQIQSNDLNSLAASIQEKLLGERFQRRTRSIN